MDVFAALVVLFVFFGLVGGIIWMSMPILLLLTKMKVDRIEKQLTAIEQKLSKIEAERSAPAQEASAGASSPYWNEIIPPQ